MARQNKIECLHLASFLGGVGGGGVKSPSKVRTLCVGG